MSDQRKSASDDMSLLKQALVKIERLQAQLNDADRGTQEPIAVIGMGCRLPQGVTDPDGFWKILEDGVDLVTETPAGRWDADAFYDPKPGAPGKLYSKAGAFLADIDGFEPQFFGIAPREAKSLDPQQRLLLEVSWQALENAGQSPEALAGAATGVFFGIGGTDYQQLQMHQQDVTLLDTYHASGMAHSVAAGRVSYALGLTGPSLAIDTACSSSLVAIHYACQSLRAGECRSALAGGVNVMLAPFSNIAFCQSSMLSPNGRCATFDAAADGFVQGEGCAVIVLKLLRDARADGDRIDAVIRGSAVNQDGASSGLTAPNGPAQEAVILAALAAGGVAPEDVSYVEAHGSGTPLGDPIEVQALAAALGKKRPPEEPLLIGSVKTNTGHLATAAGVTSVIKVILAMQQKTIPPHLHFETPNPHIPWERIPIRVATETTPWQPTGRRRIAGVSGFGFSGTNVHVVLEEAPEPDAATAAAAPMTPIPLALSARTGTALRTIAASFAAEIGGRPESDLADLVFTANAGRAHFKHRLLVGAGSARTMAEALSGLASGETAEGLRTAELTDTDAPRVAFLFSGSGAEYAGMGRELYDTEAAFRNAIDRCGDALEAQLDVSLPSVLYPQGGPSDDPALLKNSRYGYPALFALEFALAELWRSWGVEPWVVMGHGIGEYVAACVAGALGLEDAILLAAERGRLVRDLPADGAMAAVYAGEEEVRAEIDEERDRVSVAAVYGPRHVVVSGAREAVERICHALGEREIEYSPLATTQALQSPLVEPILDDLERAAGRMKGGRPAIGVVSGACGDAVAAGRLRDPGYWREQARETIRFSDAIAALQNREVGVFLEIGPGAVLSGLGAKLAPRPGQTWLPSLLGPSDERQRMYDSLGSLYLRGVAVDWRGVFAGPGYRKLVLPGYPFERERYWIDGLRVRSRTADDEAAAPHPLLGRRIESPLAEILFQAEFGSQSTPALFDHVVHGIVVVPAAAILEMAIAAGRSYFGADEFDLLDVSISEALTLQADEPTRVSLVLTPEADRRAAIRIYSRRHDGEGFRWRAHAAATLAPRAAAAGTAGLSRETAEVVEARCTSAVDVEQLYRGMWNRGLQFGAGFRILKRLSRGDGEAIGTVDAADVAESSRYRFDPAVLDACIQVVSAAMPGFDPGDTASDVYMPIGIDRVRIGRERSTPATSHAVLAPDGPASAETFSADLRVSDREGRTLLEIEGLHLKRADARVLQRAAAGGSDDLTYRIQWRPVGEAAHAGQQPARLPAPASIEANVTPLVDPLCDRHGVGIYEALSGDLDRLCAAYAVDALRRLGWLFETGRTVRTDDLLAELGIQQSHRQLVERLLGALAEERFLERTGDGWTVLGDPDLEPSEDMIARLLLEYSGCDAELQWTRRCGDHLADALRGAADPHELLFPGGDMSLATTVYSRTPLARLFNGMTAEVIRSIVAVLPEGERLDVLEIGAGTGSTTELLLETLPADRSRYTFSDIGPAFVNQARRRFADCTFADFKVLDIERDPGEQGFEDGRFNVVVASNVLHATADLRATLARVRRLLAPNGLLVLLEATAPQRWFDLTVGLTDGWWRFEDTDLRPHHPLLDGAQWSDLLLECGFDAVSVIPEAGHRAFDQAMIVGRKSAQAGAHAPASNEHWYVLADETGVADSLAESLRSQAANCVLIGKSADFERPDAGRVRLDPTRREHFDRLVSEVVEPGRGPNQFVCLWALDAAVDDAGRASALEAAQAGFCGGALHLVQALATTTLPATRLTLVTRGAQYAEASGGSVAPAQSTLWGLHKAITLEHPELRSLAIDLDPSAVPGGEEVRALLKEIRHRSDENEIVLRLGRAYASRLVPASTAAPAGPSSPAQAAVLVKPASGRLEDLHLKDVDRRSPNAGEVEIRVLASGLNFRDVLVALDVHHDFDSIGSECAGRIVSVGPGVTGLAPGDEVVAIAPRALATHAIANAGLTIRKPRAMTFADAVTLPIAFLTADFALNHVGRMAAGDVVLIHAATGGVGMAALQLARRAGATVLATAGSEPKRDYLRQLGVAHVMSSRTLDFAAEALAITGGRGVDIVLNGLTGEFIDRGIEILAPGGRFLELGKSDVRDPDRVAAVNPDASYHAVDLTGDMLDDPQSLRPLLENLVRRIEAGELHPLPRQCFPLGAAADAFRHMEQARHVGKVVLTQADPDTASREIFRDDGTYLVVGGLSGLGERVAEWAVEQGARHLVLAGRRPPSADMREKIRGLEKTGASVRIVRCDVSRETDVRDMLADIADGMPPLRGLFHSAGLLDDGLLLQQDWQRFEYVMAPKVSGAWLLHTLTRDLPLDFFVMFSSIASVLGGSGAGNHSAANAFLDALAHCRRQQGMPSLSINWGAWSEIGAAVRDGASAHVASRGLGFISPAQGLGTLGEAMQSQADRVAVLAVDWPVFFERDPQQRQRPLLAEIVARTRPAGPAETGVSKTSVPVPDFAERLAAVYPNQRPALIEEHVAACAGEVLGLDSAAIDTRLPLSEMGLDSLMAVELRNTLQASIGKQLPATLLFDYPTVVVLSGYLANDVLAVDERPETGCQVGEFDLLDSIENLSDEEVDRAFSDNVENG